MENHNLDINKRYKNVSKTWDNESKPKLVGHKPVDDCNVFKNSDVTVDGEKFLTKRVPSNLFGEYYIKDPFSDFCQKIVQDEVDAFLDKREQEYSVKNVDVVDDELFPINLEFMTKGFVAILWAGYCTERVLFDANILGEDSVGTCLESDVTYLINMVGHDLLDELYIKLRLDGMSQELFVKRFTIYWLRLKNYFYKSMYEKYGREHLITQFERLIRDTIWSLYGERNYVLFRLIFDNVEQHLSKDFLDMVVITNGEQIGMLEILNSTRMKYISSIDYIVSLDEASKLPNQIISDDWADEQIQAINELAEIVGHSSIDGSLSDRSVSIVGKIELTNGNGRIYPQSIISSFVENFDSSNSIEMVDHPTNLDKVFDEMEDEKHSLEINDVYDWTKSHPLPIDKEKSKKDYSENFEKFDETHSWLKDSLLGGENITIAHPMEKILTKPSKLDTIEKAPQYNSEVFPEVIVMMEDNFKIIATMCFAKLNSFKYRMRTGLKDVKKIEEDIKKAMNYESRYKVFLQKMKSIFYKDKVLPLIIGDETFEMKVVGEDYEQEIENIKLYLEKYATEIK